MVILGIETSCDETAAAVVQDGSRVLSNMVYSQIAHHRPYGGVVPGIASRSHVEVLPRILEDAIKKSGVDWDQLDAVAVTRGPGLASSLLVGLAAAKALAYRLGKPMIGVNHLQAHLHSVFLGDDAPSPEEMLPAIALLVSGGHSCLVRVESQGSFQLLGQTLDDAAGEALDKGASLMDLGYPGGPVIEKTAQGGNATFVDFPRGLKTRGKQGDGPDRSLCFSFSGLKTSLRYFLENNPDALEGDGVRDVAASYQEAVVDSLVSKLELALANADVQNFLCVGGVARNTLLRDRLAALAEKCGKKLWLAAPDYCTDNAAMVAAFACHCAPDETVDWQGMDVEPNLSVEST